MTRTAFERDGILTPAERTKSAAKCMELLVDHTGAMTEKEGQFVDSMHDRLDFVSERQLAWLRDLVERYAQ